MRWHFRDSNARDSTGSEASIYPGVRSDCSETNIFWPSCDKEDQWGLSFGKKEGAYVKHEFGNANWNNLQEKRSTLKQKKENSTGGASRQKLSCSCCCSSRSPLELRGRHEAWWEIKRPYCINEALHRPGPERTDTAHKYWGRKYFWLSSTKQLVPP